MQAKRQLNSFEASTALAFFITQALALLMDIVLDWVR